jgi:iron(III) transport system substrate-binding protein
MPRFARLSIGFVATAVLVGSASPCSAQATSSWQQVVEAGKKEGKVIIYNASPAKMPKVYADIFQKNYGIPVEILNARASEIRERIRIEQASERFLCDVVLIGNSTAVRQADNGVFQLHPTLPNASKLLSSLADDGTIMPYDITLFAFITSSRRIPDGEEPKSWSDLLDPKWTGKVLIEDPRVEGAGSAGFSGLFDGLGRDFHEALAKQRGLISVEPQTAERRLALGEFSIYVPFLLQNITTLTGLPIKAIIPKEGVPYSPTVASVAKNAPHPNAAALFLNALLDEQAQTALVDNGGGSVIGRKSDKRSTQILSFASNELLVKVDARKQQEMMETFRQIYK